MELDEVIFALVLLGLCSMALMYASSQFEVSTYEDDVTLLLRDICAVRLSPGARVERTYYIDGKVVVRNGSITLSQSFWVYVYCFTQPNATTLTGPVITTEKLELEGLEKLVLLSTPRGVVIEHPNKSGT